MLPENAGQLAIAEPSSGDAMSRETLFTAMMIVLGALTVAMTTALIFSMQ